MADTGRAAVDIALCGLSPELSEGWQQSLREYGYLSFDTINNGSKFQQRIDERRYDLLIVDNNMTDDLLQTLRSVRFGVMGMNPFVVMIMTASDGKKSTIMPGLKAGIDDILLTPASTSDLYQRIQRQVAQRKPFLATSGYVGPDRRNDQQRSSEIETFIPPNTLQMKEDEEEFDLKQLQQSIYEAKKQLLTERTRRLVFDIAMTVKLCLPCFDDLARRQELASYLAKVETLWSDAIWCITSSRTAENVTELFSAFGTACVKTRQNPAQTTTEERALLMQMSLAMLGLIHEESDSSKLEMQIIEAVDRYIKREAVAK